MEQTNNLDEIKHFRRKKRRDQIGLCGSNNSFEMNTLQRYSKPVGYKESYEVILHIAAHNLIHSVENCISPMHHNLLAMVYYTAYVLQRYISAINLPCKNHHRTSKCIIQGVVQNVCSKLQGFPFTTECVTA